MVRNLPSNRDSGSVLGQGTKIPYHAGQLGPHAAVRSLHAGMKILYDATKTQHNKINTVVVFREREVRGYVYCEDAKDQLLKKTIYIRC